MINVLDITQRKAFLDKTRSNENINRKKESLKRSEIYQKRQEKYVNQKLRNDGFSENSIKKMRKIYSINLTPRIIDELAGLYKDEPVRSFSNKDKDLTEDQLKQIENLYRLAKADQQFKNANRKYKLQNQGTIQVVPSGGKITLRVLQPHHYDVIPNDINPEIADGYVISAFEKEDNQPSIETKEYQAPYAKNDNTKNERYVWWTKENNFITDGEGVIISETYLNELGELPFHDFAAEKDFKYWVDLGSDVVEFALDFAIVLSDIATINRLQGYAQGVVTSEKAPAEIEMGTGNFIHLPMDPNRPEATPKLEFVNPNPDLPASLSFLDMLINYFLTSMGADSSVVSSKGEAVKFSSGIDRLLDMLQKYDRSKEDMAMFREIEEKVFKTMVKISNSFQGTTDNPLVDDLKLSVIPEDTTMTITYVEPQMIQSKKDMEDSVIKLLKEKLTTRKQALMDIYGIDEAAADKLMKDIDTETESNTPKTDSENNPEDPKDEESEEGAA